MTSIKLALDWTPNPLHAGFLIAKAQGKYDEANLQVELISPADDNYATTPAKKLSSGEVDFALCPSESIISFQTSSTPVKIKACAALLARDASVIVSRSAKSPKELVGEGKVYASYGARYEDAIVQAMIDKDAGGTSPGKLNVTTPPKLGIWNTVVNGDTDSTWIFEPFEGVQARRAGHKLNYFKLEDYGIPYGYSPVVAYNEERFDANKQQAYETFLRITGEGYVFATQNPEEAAKIVREAMLHAKLSAEDTDATFLEDSQNAINPYYNLPLPAGFGYMEPQVWEIFISWLHAQGLLKDRSGQDADVKVQQLYTNAFLRGGNTGQAHQAA